LAARPAESSRPDGTAAEPPPPRTAGPDRRTPAEKQVGPAPGPALPPPVPPELIPALWFEHRLQVDGWTLVPELDRLRPPRTGIARRSWDLAISDARLGGLGWTERLETRSGIDGLHWALDARWAPPLLSASPAAVGLGGAVIAEGPEGAAVAAPRSSWHGAGLLAGPLGPSFGLALAFEALGTGLPAPQPGLAAGHRAAQKLLLGATFLPGARDTVSLTLLGLRHTESPDCFRCTEAAARQVTGLDLGGTLRWRHRLEPGELEVHAGLEVRRQDAGAVRAEAGASVLDLSTWITDGAPGPLDPSTGASAESTQRSRLGGGASLELPVAAHLLLAGVEATLDRFHGARWTPGGQRLVNRNGPCDPDGRSGCAFRVMVDAVDVPAQAWAVAAYLQDSAVLAPGFHARLGLRAELGAGEADGTGTGTRIGLGPRLALSWDVGNRGTHWLISQAGRSHDLALLDAVLNAQRPLQRIGVWDATAGTFSACGTPAPDCVWSGGPGRVAAGGLPHVDGTTLGWRGRLDRRSELGLEVSWQRISGLWTEHETRLLTDSDGLWLPPADGIWRTRRLVVADPEAWRRTLSLGAWFQLRPGAFRLQGAWRVARVEGTAAAPFDAWRVDPRTSALARGPLPDDHRHRASLTVGWLPHPGVLVETRMRFVSGGPLWETAAVPGSEGRRTVLASRGDGLLDGKRVPLRDPDVATLDVRLRLRLHAWLVGWPRMELTLEALRAVGGNAPVRLSASESRLGSVLRREPPLHVAIGLRAGD